MLNDNGKTYPFLYFTDLNNPLANRKCVNDCPQSGLPVYCYDQTQNDNTQPCNIGYYPNYPQVDRIGAYCLPSDDAAR